MEGQTSVIVIAPIKNEEELNQDHQPSMKPDPVNVEDGTLSTFPESADVSYSVGFTENKFRSTTPQSYNSLISTNLPDIFDQKAHDDQMSDSPCTFTPAQLKKENQKVSVKSEIDEVEDNESIVDSSYNVPEPMSSMSFIDTKPASCPEETNILPVPILKQEETINTMDLDINADKMISDSTASLYRNTELMSMTCVNAVMQQSDPNVHILEHTGEKLYKCHECGRLFTDRRHFVEHNRIHTGEKPFKCNECGKSFARSGYLTIHKRTHNDEKRYECKVCGKAFHQSNNLKNHSRIHTGDKPFECTICGKSFTESGHLTSHSLIHSGIKPFKCSVCGKSFTRNSHLTRHSKIHGVKGSCDEMVPSDEKSFRCNVCGKSFGTNSHLIRHSQIHSGEKPHKCNICGKAFNQSSNLKKHTLIHNHDSP